MKVEIKKTEEGYEVKMITAAGYVYTATGTKHGFIPARVAASNEDLVRKAWKTFDKISSASERKNMVNSKGE